MTKDGTKPEGERSNDAAATEQGVQSALVSDVLLAESETAAAPTFRMPAAPAVPPGSPTPAVGHAAAPRKPPADMKPMALLPGAKVDDFEIVRMLGRGAFGHVYLAKQVSLDRLVALKISANRGSEGRTMARLEHQHIVQVFAEKVDPDFNQRLLCMQLVPGIGLDRLISLLHDKRCQEPFLAAATASSDRCSQQTVPDTFLQWTGAEMLAVIDQSASLPAALDPSALHDREALAHMDAVEATAWLGGRLAEALDFAHRHGVLHRDIKPANILVNPYGRPMLADFNISSQPAGSEPGEELFGGTFSYMSPEHLDAFNPSHPAGHDVVTGRSDIYSLGLVLQQMLDGQMVFPPPERKPDNAELLRDMSIERRRSRPACREGAPSARKVLERTISRCLEPEPKDRFATGAELAQQLDGCRQLRAAERNLPKMPAMFSTFFRWRYFRSLAEFTTKLLAATAESVSRHPFLWLVLLVVLPQIAGSIVNIAYNNSQIVGQLSPAQQTLFNRLVVIYNAAIYPLAIVLFVRAVLPVSRCWKALSGTEPLTDDEVEAARRQALQLPQWIAALTALGWFPGGIIFPLVIYLLAPPFSLHLAGHFFTSFFLSGLIALAYSLCGAQFIMLRILYPPMWRDVRTFAETARKELAPMNLNHGYIHFLAGSIPLLSALLILGLAADRLQATLVMGLIVLGWVGFQLASAVIRVLSQVVVTLTGAKG